MSEQSIDMTNLESENAVLRAALKSIVNNPLANGESCEWCGGVRLYAQGYRLGVDHVPNCPVVIAKQALIATRSDKKP